MDYLKWLTGVNPGVPILEDNSVGIVKTREKGLIFLWAVDLSLQTVFFSGNILVQIIRKYLEEAH